MPDEELGVGGSQSHHDTSPPHEGRAGKATVSPHPAAGEGGRPVSSEQFKKDGNQAARGREEDATQPEQLKTYPSGFSNDARSTGDDSAPPSNNYEDNYQDNTGNYPKGSKRRTPRQQEQNKHAQQRYRAKRKAHFDELHDTVNGLMAELQASEREKRALELEILTLRRRESERHLAPAIEPVDAIIQALVARGVIPPVAAASAAMPPPPVATVMPPPSPAVDTPTFSSETIYQMLGAFKAELWAFLTTNNLFYPANLNNLSQTRPSTIVAPALMPELMNQVNMGLELAKQVLHVSGPDSELILYDGAPSHPNAADEPNRWREVVSAVAPTSEQILKIASLRDSFILGLQGSYTARMELKTAGFQSLGTNPDTGMPRWAEEILLHAASNAGYGLLAQANSELYDCVQKLKVSIDQDRAQLETALSQVLLNILTPLQAVKYLAKSHPFSWNILAFFNIIAPEAS